MSNQETIPIEVHREQIEEFKRERSCYVTYAAVLERVLKEACKESLAIAVVQARAKSVSSFAEKCARKYDKYKDAVHQMTDLCGARVIVQTLEQVRAVRQFIEANFHKVEAEDKGLLLSQDEFGYRDMHYIVQLRPDRDLGITPDERAEIGDRKAEIQVRTWLQHAWADTLHDRMYKTKLHYSPDTHRTGALLAALMEEGDRSYEQLATEIDGLLLNYSAYAPRVDVEREIAIQDTILQNEENPDKKPQSALSLARLVAACGDYGRVTRILDPYSSTQGPVRCGVLLELGYALCKEHRAQPRSRQYQRGQSYLAEAASLCQCDTIAAVPDVRRSQSLLARARVRLAWSWQAVQGKEHEARRLYRQALEREPANPYYLADLLGFELSCEHSADLAASLCPMLLQAISACHDHAMAGTELPYAYFTAGRFHLLLGQDHEALGCYARAVRHVLGGAHCVPKDVLDTEISWLYQVKHGVPLQEGFLWVRQLLGLARHVTGMAGEEDELAELRSSEPLPLQLPVLIIAGGAVTLKRDGLEQAFELLLPALAEFQGTVISGGTKVGIPGCIGEIAKRLGTSGKRGFKLIGYVPERTPEDAPKDRDRYDHLVLCGRDKFSPGQVLCNWADILVAGIDPQKVLLLGFGGGPISAAEYRIALALGATVAVVVGSGGEADRLATDPLWTGVRTIFAMPQDKCTVHAYIISAGEQFDAKTLEAMARGFHGKYVEGSVGKLPSSMRPWEKLDKTFQKANFEQARYAVRILEAAGFVVRKAEGMPNLLDFSDGEVELMAEMEHGRWNVERLRDGWCPGKPRDDAKKIHDCIVSWNALPPEIKQYDYTAVRTFPEILAKAGLEVYRPAEA